MLDDDERPPAGTRQRGDGVPHLRGAAGVEHRRRLVEQHEGGVQREGPREREPLGLPAGQRRGGGVEGERPEADRGQRLGDDGGHRRPGHPDVLETERDVPADGRRDHAGARLLEHQAGRAGARTGSGAVEGHRAVQLAGLDAAEEPGERPQQRRLARPRRPDEQHALAGCQGEGDVAQDRLAPTVGPPGEALDLDPAPRRHGLRQPGTPAAPGPRGTPRAPRPGPAPG